MAGFFESVSEVSTYFNAKNDTMGSMIKRPFKRDLKARGAFFYAGLYPTLCPMVRRAVARVFWHGLKSGPPGLKIGILGKTPRKNFLACFEVTTHLQSIDVFNG